MMGAKVGAILVLATLSAASCSGDRKSPKKNLPPPTGVVAMAEDSRIFISWDPVDGASSYYIYWSTTPSVTKESGNRTWPVTSPYLHVGLTNGVTYYYVVTAVPAGRARKESAVSQEEAAQPLETPLPTALARNGLNVISWNQPVPGAATFNIYWSTTSPVTKSNGNPIPMVTSPFAHTGLTNGTTYSYVVTSENFVGRGAESVESPEIRATPFDCIGPDVTFDGDGFAVHHDAAGGNNHDYGLAMVIDASQRILVTGRSSAFAGADDMIIWRYTPDGALDSTFGSMGWVLHDGAAGGSNVRDEGRDLTLDASGRILVAGQSGDGVAARLAIWRYLPDGTLDQTFDGDGWVIGPNVIPGEDYIGRGITIDDQGRILVAGEGYGAFGNFMDMMIWRYNPDGTPDLTFDTRGWVAHHDAAGGSEFDYGNDVTVDASGRVLVTGVSWDGIDYDMVVWRYNDDGSLDMSFDSDGWVVHHGAGGGNATDNGLAITMDAAGRILVTGYSDGNGPDMVIWRFLPDGMLDTSFDGDGWTVHDNAAGGTGGSDQGSDIVVDASGRILISGESYNPGSGYKMVVWRYNPDGTLDTTLRGKGWLLQDDSGGGNDGSDGRSIALDSLWRIVVGGTSFNPSTGYDMTISRFCD